MDNLGELGISDIYAWPCAFICIVLIEWVFSVIFRVLFLYWYLIQDANIFLKVIGLKSQDIYRVQVIWN